MDKEDWKDFSTLDLEKHYFDTGEKIEGPCEMRWAWRYNDLQPRCYYCIGGSNYWPARYAKRIAQIFMDCHPMCHRLRRRFPADVSNYLSPEWFFTIWDMTSFTTTLSELRFFLFWTAKFLEQDARLRQRPTRLFDYREGIIETPIWEILLEYNQEVNIHATFDIHRITDILGLVDLDDTVFEQQNSGMLGVPGNIGFSTTEHTLHGSAISVDVNAGVGVGDDMGIATEEHPEENLFPHLNLIGIVHPEKAFVYNPFVDGEIQAWKFVKRRFERTSFGMELGMLFDFPILPIAFATVNPQRTVILGTMEDRIIKITGQIGAFLWELNAYSPYCSDIELQLVLGIFTRIYQKMGDINCHGVLPGQKITTGLISKTVIPPLKNFDPRQEDWAEVLWDRAPALYALLPIRVEDRVPMERFLYVGQQFECTDSSLSRVLVDLGVLGKPIICKSWVQTKSENKRIFLGWLKSDGCRSLSSYNS
jgi:hypothetical protein